MIVTFPCGLPAACVSTGTLTWRGLVTLDTQAAVPLPGVDPVDESQAPRRPRWSGC
jgi:hypothetical protein